MPKRTLAEGRSQRAHKLLGAAIPLVNSMLEPEESLVTRNPLQSPLVALSKARHQLKHAMTVETIGECKACVRDALEWLEGVARVLAAPAVLLGAKGGKKTAERGPEYFKKIAAMRKTRAGGRPRKQTK